MIAFWAVKRGSEATVPNLFSRLEYAILGRLPVSFGSMVLAQKSAAYGPTSEDSEFLATSGPKESLRGE